MQCSKQHHLTPLPCQCNERPLETHVVYLRTCSESDQTRLKILAPQDFPACRGSGHRILARIAHLCHVRFYAGSDAAGTRLNTATQFRNIGLAHLSGHRHCEHDVLAGWRQLGQMRFYAGLDPAFARLNAGAQFLDIGGAGLTRFATAAEPDSSSAVSMTNPDRIPATLDFLHR